MGRIVIGTSSWADPGFVEEWYPQDLPARKRLAWYAEHFEAVEVNSTFYAVPTESTVRRWVDETPDGFSFDVKLHRLLSRHSAGLDSLPKDLRKPAKTTSRGRVKLDDKLQDALADAVLNSVQPLADAGKLSSFLLQLSPGFAPRGNGLDELAPLVERLAPHPLAIELRRSSWLRGDRAEKTLAWMEEHGAVWVCTDMPDADHLTIMPPLDAVTNPRLAYFRAHGRNVEGYIRGRSVPERFAWRYSDEELEEIGARTRELAGDADEVRLMFNNNARDYAPTAALRFKELADASVEPDTAGLTGR